MPDQTDHDLPELLTIAEAAEVLRVSKKTLYRAIARGRLHTMRLNDGPHRIPREQVLAARRGHSQEAAAG